MKDNKHRAWQRMLSGRKLDILSPSPLDIEIEEQAELQDRARPFEQNPARVREVIESGCERAREVAEETLNEVRLAVGTKYQ